MEWEQVVYLVFYMDELLIFNKNIDKIKRIKTIFFEKFDMKGLGELPFCLGIQVTKDRMKRMINLGQAEYIGTKALKWFGMEESKLLWHLLMSMSNSTKNKLLVQKRRLLKWEKYHTRQLLDLYRVCHDYNWGWHCDCNNNYKSIHAKARIEHWKVVKRIMKYLQGACDY